MVPSLAWLTLAQEPQATHLSLEFFSRKYMQTHYLTRCSQQPCEVAGLIYERGNRPNKSGRRAAVQPRLTPCSKPWAFPLRAAVRTGAH